MKKDIETQMRYFTDEYGLARQELIVTYSKDFLNRSLNKKVEFNFKHSFLKKTKQNQKTMNFLINNNEFRYDESNLSFWYKGEKYSIYMFLQHFNQCKTDEDYQSYLKELLDYIDINKQII